VKIVKEPSKKSTKSAADIYPGHFEEIELGQNSEEGDGSKSARSKEQAEELSRMQLLKIPGVSGVGLGEDFGEPVVNVYVNGNPALLKKQIPDRINGKRTKIIKSGEFVAL
jgi:hypothetical protein